MKARLNNAAPLYKERDPASTVVVELPKATELEIVRSTSLAGADWLEVALASGERGFLKGPNSLIALQDVVLDQDPIPLTQNPVPGSTVIGEIARNDRLVVLETIPPATGEMGPGWCLVRHETLGEGYVPGNARIRPADIPEPTWWRSFLGGGTIIGGIAVIGAVVLGVRFEWGAAIFLLVLCFLTGGLAGIVHFATRHIREREFGPHLAWGLVLATYLFSVLGFLFLANRLGLTPPGGDVQSLLDPHFISLLVGTCILVGVYFGYKEQRQRHQEDHRPWTWAQRLVPLLGGLAVGGILIGGIWLIDLEKVRALATEANEPPQEMTLRDLVHHGHGDNRYVSLRDFRHADRWVVDEVSEVGRFTQLRGWAILVPGKEPAFPRAGAKTPKRALALLATYEMVQEEGSYKPGPQRVRDPLSHAFQERVGLRVMVMNGIRNLPRSVQEGLQELAPDTDLDQVILLAQRVEPLSYENWQQARLQWIVVSIGGMLLLLLSLAWGWRRA